MNLKFLENNKEALIQITITNRKNKGFGCVFVDLSDDKEAKVRFMAIIDENFPPDLKKTILERRENNRDSVAYFICTTKEETNIIEVD